MTTRRRTRHEVNRYTIGHEGGPRYVEVPDSAKVLVVEDALDRVKRFKEWLPKARVVASVSRAVDEVEEEMPDIVFLDRDLTDSLGEDFAGFLAAIKFKGRVYITSANPFGVRVISKVLGDAAIEFEAIPSLMLGVVRTPEGVCRGSDIPVRE